MCYLIAKRYKDQGCIAYEAERSKTLAALVKYLGLRMLDRDV